MAADHGEKKAVMINATYLKAHRTTASLGVKKEAWTPDRSDQGRHEHEAARYLRQPRTLAEPIRDCRTGQR